MFVVGCSQAQQNCKFFLDLDDQIGLVKAELQALVASVPPARIVDAHAGAIAGRPASSQTLRQPRRHYAAPASSDDAQNTPAHHSAPWAAASDSPK